MLNRMLKSNKNSRTKIEIEQSENVQFVVLRKIEEERRHNKTRLHSV